MLLYLVMMSSFPVAILNTVDYIDPTGRCVFRTTAGERHKVVFQMVCVIISTDCYCYCVYRDHVILIEL